MWSRPIASFGLLPIPRIAVRHTLVFLFLLLLAGPAVAQTGEPAPTHAELLSNLTAACLEVAVEDTPSFRFLPQGASDLVSSPLVASWTQAGKTVYREPSDAAVSLLVVTTDQAAVDLQRLGRSRVRRTVTIDVTWWMSSFEGDVVGTDTCRSSLTDELTRVEAEAMAVNGSSILDPALPPRSRLMRAAQPVVLLGASAVGTYLLFNLRSQRSDNG